MEIPYIRAAVHLQLQKIGKSEKEKKKIINSFRNDAEYQEIKDINVVGLDLTVLQNQALHAIQVLLDQTNYEGNMEPTYMNSPAFGFEGYLPVIKFTPACYYDAFGLTKYKTKSGKNQFRGGDRENAIEALRSLFNRQFIICYTQKVYSENKKIKGYKKVHVKVFRKLFGDIEQREVEDKNGNKYLQSIMMTMSPVFVAQLKSYTVAKPINYIQEVKKLSPRASEYVYRFIEHVLNQSRLNNKNGLVRVSEDALANQLRMDNFIKRRKGKEIRKVIEKSLEVAKGIDFISSYSIINNMIEFQINYNKLVKVKK
jgi:hypothetical protein